jgi:hypothetical protein
MFGLLNNSHYTYIIFEVVQFGHGRNKSELLLRKAHMLGDPTKLVTIIANYIFEFSFMTQILHLEGEEVFSSTKCSANCFPRVDDNSHRPDHVNVFCPCVANLPIQPNNVDNMSINRHVH